MTRYKAGDLIELDEFLIVTDAEEEAHILTSDTPLQVDEVQSGGMLIVHDHFNSFGQFCVREEEVSPALMTCF